MSLRSATLCLGGVTKQLVIQVWKSRETMRLKLKFGKTDDNLVEHFGKGRLEMKGEK